MPNENIKTLKTPNVVSKNKLKFEHVDIKGRFYD